jgi:hypothetical protein
MAAPNIVNVATITGVTTYIAGVSTVGTGNGISTVVTNAASSGKVVKINCLIATAIGSTTGVTVNHYNSASQFTGAAATVSLASTMTVPTFSSLAVIDKTNSIYLQENEQIGVIAQSNAGTLDVVCSYEEIS